MLYDEQRNSQTPEEMLIERARIQNRRVGELEAVLRSFVNDIEVVGVDSLVVDGWYDLLQTYNAACGALGRDPQVPEEDEDDYDAHPDHEGGYYDDLDIYH